MSERKGAEMPILIANPRKDKSALSRNSRFDATKVVAVCRAAFHQHTRTDIRGCNDNRLLRKSRVSPVAITVAHRVCRLSGNYSPPRRLSTWASVDLAAAIRKLASVALKARRQNELSLIRTRMVRSGKATQRFISRTVKPYRAPREHYAFIADCIHR
jgi:hypothetical protein